MGCIPSKALLAFTELFHHLNLNGAEHGIVVKGFSMDLAALMKKKTSVVDQLRKGVSHLVTKRGIQVFKGHGTFGGNGKVSVTSGSSKTILSAKHILIATGSKVVELPSSFEETNPQ